MYSGGKPERFLLDTAYIRSLLVTGENVFAIEVHNIANSSDISLIPFLSFSLNDSYALFDITPSSLNLSGVENFHTNFKISSEGEKIYLFNTKTASSETVLVNNLSYGWSAGRTTDGAETWGIFIFPTPKRVNNTKAYSLEREPEPVFSVAEGYYTAKQTVSLSSASPTSEIRYTLDGSEPVSSSILFNGTHLSISATKILRAKSFSKGDKLPSNSVSNSYFINGTVHTVPVLSVITDNSNLYGSTGIFDNPNQEWEKPSYVEYFDSQKNKKFEQFSGIQIDGGAGGSRTHPQHSFRLEFDHNIYGSGDVLYKLIPDQPKRENYKSIYLRNGSNRYLSFMFKDAMQCKMMSYNTNNYYSTFTPAVVYINGSYFGLYEMREKINDEYFKNNFNANIDSAFHLLTLSYYYNLVLRALNGSVDTFTSDYNKFLSLKNTDPDYLQKADKIIDIEYYTDYIIAHSWIADTDWPFNNIKIVKGDFSNYRWRFVLLDLEWALQPDGWTSSNFDHISYMLNYDSGVPYIRFWKELMKNPEYKKKFITRFADIMNLSYLNENTIGIAQSIYDSTFTEMRGEYVKWGGGESQANSNMLRYSDNMTTFKSELSKRTDFVRGDIISNFGLTGKYSLELQVQPENTGVIQINTISPEIYPWSGVYFAGVPVKMEAKGIGNYVFDGWEANTVIKDINNPVIEADVKTNGYKFIAKFKKMTPAQAITISEINYSSSDALPSSDWIELYNFGTTIVDLTGWYITDENPLHKWVIPGSFILKANERLVLSANINNFNNVYPNVQNVVGSFPFGLGSDSDSVLLYNNNNKLAAGLKYSNGNPWPDGTIDLDKTIELRDPWSSLNDADNWFAGCSGGSPGTVFTSCTGTGISSSPEIFTASIYPNPAISEINIEIPMAFNDQETTCRIFDIMGKELITESFRNASRNTLNISVVNLSEGIYFVQVSNGFNQLSLKFIKEKE
jgi:hypothetical protein